MDTYILPDHWAMRLLQMQGRNRNAQPRPDGQTSFSPDHTGHTVMPLSRMRPGQHGHILSLCPDCAVRHHLLELGFTTGTEVEFVRAAPLGDPLTIRLRGYQLSLRTREAEAVTVRVCPPEVKSDMEAAEGLPQAE